MYYAYIKRIIKVDVAGENPEELLKLIKEKTLPEKIISNTFIVEDEKGIIADKEKVIYEGDGHAFVYTNL